jgi:molybdate transport system ATP-binding protein
MSFFRVDNLHINLIEFQLREVSFCLDQGDYMMIIGPTGAGKTILLESIVGFWKPEKGRIWLEGSEITQELPEHRNIGIVYQDYALIPHFTVFENIAYGLKKKTKNGIGETVKDIAASLKIEHLLHRKPETLSGGEQQRVALARSLVVEPKLLLMDEPFSALDPRMRRETRHLLLDVLARRKTTVIHISHDLNDAWALANKLAIFRDGLLLQFGTIEDVFRRPQSRFIADFVGASILDGTVVANGSGPCLIDVGDFHLTSIDCTDPGKKVQVALRPEDIIVSKERPSGISAQNIIATRLERVVPEGRASFLHLAVNETELSVLVTNNAVAQLGVSPGDTIYAIIKSANVRIVQ